jgi:hypothetical protein
VDREQAAQALAILRNVVAQTRNDTVLQNWGPIWIVHAFTNGGGFIGTHFLLAAGYRDPPPFVTMWAVLIAIDLLTVVVLKKERAGVRTFVETQLWSIWLTFIAAVALIAVLNHVMGLDTFFLGPVISVLGAVGFASMGSLMGPRWYAGSAFFGATAVLMAALPHLQFAILGVAWGGAQFFGGVALERARRRRLAQGDAQARVV